jgi:hypothetical protein
VGLDAAQEGLQIVNLVAAAEPVDERARGRRRELDDVKGSREVFPDLVGGAPRGEPAVLHLGDVRSVNRLL